MATITRIEAIEQIQKVLKAYACKIYELRHDAECLPPAGKAIIDSYCCNENEEQNLIRQACLRVSFFKNVNNNQLLDFYVVCYGLNEYLGLGVKDLIQVTDVTEDKESFWETFWGALQGEFNEDPSGASILIDMSLNFIPGVGQVLDARDIIACLDKLVLQRRYEEVTVWATLILTAIGCIPYAGDVIKAIGKSIIKEADDIVLMLLKKLDAEDVYSAFIKFYEILQESIEDAIKLIDKWLREAAGRYKESDLGELIRNANGYIKKAWGVIQTKIDEFGERVFGIDRKSGLSETGSNIIKLENSASVNIKEYSTEIFDKNGKLKPNIKYTAGEYKYWYKTDELGRICSCQADELYLKQHIGRLKHNPNTPGKREGDQAGHLIADVFGGSPELNNLVSQAKNVNQKLYRDIERKWQQALNKIPPDEITDLKIEIIYDGNNVRPAAFSIEYCLNGKLIRVPPIYNN